MTTRSFFLCPKNFVVVWAFAGLLLLSTGCVYSPVKSPDRLSTQFGNDTNAVFRIGVSQRDAVFHAFGKPSYATQHDLAWGYLFAVKTAAAKGLLMGPCMPYVGSTEIWEGDDVWLEFDESGILKRIEKQLKAKCHNNPELAWREFTKTVPDQIQPEQMSDKKL